MRPARFLTLVLSLLTAPAFADIISGTVTDYDSKSPLAGVKVSVGNASTVTGADGKYSLNTTAPTSVLRLNPVAGFIWNAAAGAFQWERRHGAVRIEVRDLRGLLVEGKSIPSGPGVNSHVLPSGLQGIHFVSIETELGSLGYRMARVGGTLTMSLADAWSGHKGGGASSAEAPLAKTTAVNNLSYAKDGYNNAVQRVDGSKSNVDVTLKKGNATLRPAVLTWFESYPDPGSEECIKYNGCTWAGMFAAVSGKQPKEWVAANNIAAVHSKDFNAYRLKTLRLQQGGRQIDAKVYDMCSDSDCSGCCTRNAGSAGFLIDLEIHTAERFGTKSGTVNWMCLDCN